MSDSGNPRQPYPPMPAPGLAYADWGTRAMCWLWDLVYLWPALVSGVVGTVLVVVGVGLHQDGSSGAGATLVAIGALVLVGSVALGLWRFIRNYMIDQGHTGYTYGRRKMGVRLIGEGTGAPTGVGSCVARYFLHTII